MNCASDLSASLTIGGSDGSIQRTERATFLRVFNTLTGNESLLVAIFYVQPGFEVSPFLVVTLGFYLGRLPLRASPVEGLEPSCSPVRLFFFFPFLFFLFRLLGFPASFLICFEKRKILLTRRRQNRCFEALGETPVFIPLTYPNYPFLSPPPTILIN